MEEEGRNGEMISWFGKIEIDQRILDAVNDDWRSLFYNLVTDQQVAEHLAYNFVVNHCEDVRRLDGWADQPDDVVCKLVRE
jgi:hypothetical protein